MYSSLLPLHSIFRWLVLLMMLTSIYVAYNGWKLKLAFTPLANSIRHWTATLAHIQLMLGMVLYFYSPIVKYSMPVSSRALMSQHAFFKYLHIAFMLFAIVVLTIGSAKAKRASTASAQYKTILIWYTVALILILIAIPWPFSPFASRPLFR